MINLTKYQFKICEAVALGLNHYYMGPRDKREVTATEHAEAPMPDEFCQKPTVTRKKKDS